jgi:hypothetical protein
VTPWPCVLRGLGLGLFRCHSEIRRSPVCTRLCRPLEKTDAATKTSPPPSPSPRICRDLSAPVVVLGTQREAFCQDPGRFPRWRLPFRMDLSLQRWSARTAATARHFKGLPRRSRDRGVEVDRKLWRGSSRASPDHVTSHFATQLDYSRHFLLHDDQNTAWMCVR